MAVEGTAPRRAGRGGRRRCRRRRDRRAEPVDADVVAGARRRRSGGRGRRRRGHDGVPGAAELGSCSTRRRDGSRRHRVVAGQRDAGGHEQGGRRRAAVTAQRRHGPRVPCPTQARRSRSDLVSPWRVRFRRLPGRPARAHRSITQRDGGQLRAPGSSSATHSTCAVIGKASNARRPPAAYRPAPMAATSRPAPPGRTRRRRPRARRSPAPR